MSHPALVPGMLARGRPGLVIHTDGEVTRTLDDKRILWAAGDIVENRPPLSRWHPDHTEAFAAFVRKG